MTAVLLDKGFFRCLETFDIENILSCTESQIGTVLPLLTRCCLCNLPDEEEQAQKSNDSVHSVANTDEKFIQNPTSTTKQTAVSAVSSSISSGQLKRQQLMKTLLGFNDVNHLIESLSTDFNQVMLDCLSQLSLRKKQRTMGESISHPDSVLTDFESFSAVQRLRTIITEIKWLIEMRSEQPLDDNKTAATSTSKVVVPPILQLSLFRDSITDLLCIALHELPSLLPTSDVVEGLLYLDDPLEMILKVIVNSPWCVNEVCCALILRADEQHPSTVSQMRVGVIKYICKISPAAASLSAQTCVSSNKLPHLLAWIYLHQEGSNVTSVKLAQFIFTYKKITKVLLAKNQTTGEESELLVTCRKVIDSELTELMESSPSPQRYNNLSVLIRLCATLRNMVAYKFTEPELEKMFKLFPSLPLNTEKDMHLMLLALCLIISSVHQVAPYSSQLSMWLRNLAHNTKLFTQSSDTSIGQFLLLIAIYFHGNQLTTISEMVATVLSIKPSTVKLSNSVLKQIVTYEVFTEQVISQLTVLLSVTEGLNANMTGYLPIHCVCQLLKSRAFSKHNVSISDWITSQLSNISLPIHPLIPQMINLYITSTMPHQHNIRSANPQLDEQKIKEQFMISHEENFASQLAFLYYVLYHQEAVHSEPATASAKKRSVSAYSSELMICIPTKLLITKAYDNRRLCGSLYPSLMKLLYTNLPHMCRADMWLPDHSICREPNQLVHLFNEHLKVDGCGDSIHRHYMRLRKVSEKMSADTLPVLMDTLKIVQASDAEEIPRHMTLLLVDTWLAYSRISPERLYPQTVNVLRNHHQSLSDDQMVTDPLLVLQCLSTCKNPDILSIVLHLVGVYSRASNRHYTVQGNSKGSAGLPDAKEICYSLLSAQESATLQIMLEHCLPDIRPGESALCNQREVQTLICSEIHKLIIENPYLAKLVSFQGYDQRVIPIAISGIPSMHICLDYVPELLAQPDINKQVFAVRLTAALCQRYGVHKTFSMAKLCINTLHTLVGILPTQSVISNILPVMSDVVTICQHMPVLYDDWIKLLATVLPVVAACQGISDISIPKSKVPTLGVER